MSCDSGRVDLSPPIGDGRVRASDCARRAKEEREKGHPPASAGMGDVPSALVSAQGLTDTSQYYPFEYQKKPYKLVFTETNDAYVTFTFKTRRGHEKTTRYNIRISDQVLVFSQKKNFKNSKEIQRTELSFEAQEAIKRYLEVSQETDTTDKIEVAGRLGTFRRGGDRIERSIAALVLKDSKPSLWQSFKAQPFKTLFYILPLRFLSLLAFICTFGYWKPSSL